MLRLAWANLTHHKLRTALCALAVGIGLAMFIVSRGLARGTIGEVAGRMQSVQAELLVMPAQENLVFSGGAAFRNGWVELFAAVKDEHGPLATAIIPAYWAQIRMGNQQQRLFGVDPEQMPLFLGPRKVLDGQPFDKALSLAQRIHARRAASTQPNVDDAFSEPEHAAGYELVIDDRLRAVGDGKRPYAVGDTVWIMGRDFRIVGVVESGVAGRVFAPIEALRHIEIDGEPHSTVFFIKLRPGADPRVAQAAFSAAAGSSGQVQLTSEYGSRLERELGTMYMYVNATNALALIVCFLFILLTMYTFVLERTREIGILKALGVSRRGLLWLSVAEALLISGTGTVIGIALAFVAKAIIAVRLPLLTVDLQPVYLGGAVLIGLVGGVGSALYPGWRAARLDPAVALGYE